MPSEQPSSPLAGLVHHAGSTPSVHTAAPRDDAPAEVTDTAQAPRQPLDRRRILDRTLECLTEVGYDKTTIRAIAKRIGCAVGSIYRHYRDKRELLAAVASSRLEAVAEYAEMGRDPAWVARLYVQAAQGHPELYRLLFWLSGVGKPHGQETVPPIINRILDGWTKTLGSANAARRFWAGVHGGVMLGLDADQAVALAKASLADLKPAESPSEDNQTPTEAPLAAIPHAEQALAAS